MAVARALRRLLRVLTVEEEQAQAALETALAQLRRAEKRLDAAVERERSGRRLVTESAHSGSALDRAAGLEESEVGRRAATLLRPRVAQAEAEAAERREEFLARRLARRQAETLIREAEERDSLVRSRRAQQTTDDWYLERLHRSRKSAEALREADLDKESTVGGET